MTIDETSGITYDTDGFDGQQIGTVDIDESGDYELTVTPDDADDIGYAIAVGKDPTATESTRRIAGFAVLAAGLLHRRPADRARRTPSWRRAGRRGARRLAGGSSVTDGDVAAERSGGAAVRRSADLVRWT